MLVVLITALITFFISSLFGYVVHKSLHQKWTGRFNDAHMTHHLRLYPASDYVSYKYRNAGKDNTVKIFAIAAIPLVAIPIILGVLGLLPLGLMLTSLVVMVIMSFLHSYLHDSFHIKGHWLYRVPVMKHIFERWVYLHYLHHIDMQKNFGIFLFHWDHILQTYWADKVPLSGTDWSNK
jgi:sterol desaturase/sphingolipid hydroxylase (fatty acid hydroxylase superfamily)